MFNDLGKNRRMHPKGRKVPEREVTTMSIIIVIRSIIKKNNKTITSWGGVY